jgi:hypothetical protein
MAIGTVIILAAQSTRSPLDFAIERFKDLIDDEDFVASGQFIWARRYREELRKLATSLAQTDPALNAFWNVANPSSVSPGATQSFLSDILDTTTHPVDVKQFTRLKKQALKDPSMTSGIPAAKILRSMLQGRVDNGKATYDRATALLATGTPIRPQRIITGPPRPGSRPADPDFAVIFNPAALTFNGALSISNRAKDRCFDMTNAVCNYIGNQGGVTQKPKKPSNSPGQLFEGTTRQGLPDPGFTRFLSPLRDLIRYDTRLASAVQTAKTALDRGHLLNAAILSGARLDNRIASPDHFLPMIAWQEFFSPVPHIQFAFWDPDAKVTNAFEPGFGRLFFVAGADAQAEVSNNSSRGVVFEDNNPGRALAQPPLPKPPPKNPYTPSFWKNGRLTTALEDARLDVTDDGTDPFTQHRYQVTSMTTLPGTGALPKRRKGQ